MMMTKIPMLYFTLACAISWLFWAPMVYNQWRNPGSELDIAWLLHFLGGVGPITSAVIISAVIGGKTSVKALFRQVILWPGWYHISTAFAAPMLVCTAAVLSYSYLFGFEIETNPNIAMFLSLVLFQIPILPLEEVGWRSFLQRYLESDMDSTGKRLKSSIVVGLMWGCWHFPLFLYSAPHMPVGDTLTDLLLEFGSYCIGLVCISVLISQLVHSGYDSTSLAVVAHSSMNATIAAFLKRENFHLAFIMAWIGLVSLPFLVHGYRQDQKRMKLKQK